MEWITCTLNQLGEIVGGATPSTKNIDNYKNGNISWITPKDLSNYDERFIANGERNITNLGYASCSTKLLPKNSILFSSRAPIGYVAIAKNKLCTNQGFKSIMPNKNTDFLFLYYLLKYNTNAIINMGSGTTFKEISGKTMKSIVIRVPKDIEDQKKIASILSALDDKIELNNKINKNLEEMAQAIFKSWFVDFEPWGGEMPDDWEYGTLDEICEISSGKRPKVKSKNKTLDNTIPIIGASSIMGYTNKSLYNESLLITGRVGTHGIIQKLQKECWPSDNTLVIKSIFYNYTYQLLSKINYKNLNRGSTQPLITQTDLKKIPIVRPTDKILFAFEKLTNTFINKNILNNKQNQNLKLLRDTLLPKLMSGELDVSNLDIEI